MPENKEQAEGAKFEIEEMSDNALEDVAGGVSACDSCGGPCAECRGTDPPP